MSEHASPIGEPTIGEKLKAVAGRFKKLLLAAAGGVTGVGVSAGLGLFGIHIADSLAATIAAALAALAVAAGPANNPK